jgi:hypothetical protein
VTPTSQGWIVRVRHGTEVELKAVVPECDEGVMSAAVCAEDSIC